MKEQEKIQQAVRRILESNTDPDGWYTGVTTTDEYDQPTQEADDL